MYFWKIQKLKDDIKSGKFSEKDRFSYFIFGFTFGLILLELTSWLPVENKTIGYTVLSIANSIIALIATLIAYRVNGGANGHDFLGRYTSLVFVLLIRFIPLFVVAILGSAIATLMTFEQGKPFESTAWTILPIIVWNALYYWRLIKHFSEIRNS